MPTTVPTSRWPDAASWRDLVLPKEHGSWSLALEPLALGLLAAPSVAGGLLAFAIMSAFLARRPLRLAWSDRSEGRRAAARVALGACALAAALALGLTIAVTEQTWLIWLVPSVLAGAVFLTLDLRNAGRTQLAELAGATAFSLLAAPVALLGGSAAATAFALGLVMAGRALPTVLCLRARLRDAKTGSSSRGPALAAAAGAVALAAGLAWHGALPATGVVALGVLALRSAAWLIFPAPALRARTLGTIEALLGLAFVLSVAGSVRL